MVPLLSNISKYYQCVPPTTLLRDFFRIDCFLYYLYLAASKKSTGIRAVLRGYACVDVIESLNLSVCVIGLVHITAKFPFFFGTFDKRP